MLAIGIIFIGSFLLGIVWALGRWQYYKGYDDGQTDCHKHIIKYTKNEPAETNALQEAISKSHEEPQQHTL